MSAFSLDMRWQMRHETLVHIIKLYQQNSRSQASIRGGERTGTGETFVLVAFVVSEITNK